VVVVLTVNGVVDAVVGAVVVTVVVGAVVVVFVAVVGIVVVFVAFVGVVVVFVAVVRVVVADVVVVDDAVMVVVVTVVGIVVAVVGVVVDAVICDGDDVTEVLNVDVVEAVVVEDELDRGVDEFVADEPLIVGDKDDDEGIVEDADDVFEVNVDWEFKLVEDTDVTTVELVVPVEFNVDPELLVDVEPDITETVVDPVGKDPIEDEVDVAPDTVVLFCNDGLKVDPVDIELEIDPVVDELVDIVLVENVELAVPVLFVEVWVKVDDVEVLEEGNELVVDPVGIEPVVDVMFDVSVDVVAVEEVVYDVWLK